MSYLFNIYFQANTINGVILKNEKVIPEMFNPHIFSTYKSIYISPFIEIKNKYLPQNLGEDDKKMIFFNLPQFNNFIQRIKEKGNFKSINIKQAKEKKIIDGNINFILNLFLKKNQPFTIRNKTYLINNYKWDGTYTISVSNNNKTPSINVKIEIFLHEGKEMSFIESTRLGCLQKKQQIIKDYHVLVGLPVPSHKTAQYSNIPLSKEQLKRQEEEKKKKEEEEKKKKKSN
jgi:hypothetical protein